MEWRCEWCGKPHEADDPPCDNCGHGSFERAVAPVAPEGEGGPTVWVCTECGRDHPRNTPPCSRCGAMTLEQDEQTYEEGDPIGPEHGNGTDFWGGDDADDEPEGPEMMTVWACTACGRSHPRNTPPCSRCGGMTFEQEERWIDADADMDPTALKDADELWAGAGETDEEPDPAPTPSSTTVWECVECGRGHTRNNPPCSRCGAMSLEQREQSFEDLPTGGVGWRDAVDLQVALGFVGAIVLLVAVVATSFGLLGFGGPPSVPAEEVPGSADSAAGLELASVESAYVEALNDQRRETDRMVLMRDEGLAARATWYNRRTVQAAYGDEAPPTREQLDDGFGEAEACGGLPAAASFRATFEGGLAQFDSETALAAALLERRTVEILDLTYGYVGVDVHVGPDGTVFVTEVVC